MYRFLHELWTVDLKEIDRIRHVNNFLSSAAGTLRSHLQAGLWAFNGFWPLNITVKSGVSPKIVVKCHDPREWHLAADGEDDLQYQSTSDGLQFFKNSINHGFAN